MPSRRQFITESSFALGAGLAARHLGPGANAPLLLQSPRLAASSTVNVKDFGAVGDGIADDRAAIQAAVNSLSTAGGTVLFPSGRYRISAEITGASSVSLIGDAATVSASGRFRSCFYFAAHSDIRVEGLAFDLGQPALEQYASYPTLYNVGLWFDVACQNISVVECRFSNLYTNSIWFYHVNGVVDIIRCRFSSPSQTQQTNLQHISFTTASAKVLIDDCDFDNAPPLTAASGVCQVFASGTTNQFTIRNCRSNYGGRGAGGHHQLGAFAFYADSVNVLVDNCRIVNTMAVAVRLTAVAHAEVRGCYMAYASAGEPTTPLVSVESTHNAGTLQDGCQDIKIHHNTFVESSSAVRLAIACSSYDYSVPLTDIWITDNEFRSCQKAVEIGGPYSNIQIAQNAIRGSNGGQIAVRPAPGGVTVGALNGVTEAQGVFDGLSIQNNTFDLGKSGAQAISLSYVKSPAYRGKVGTINVRDNTINAAAAIETQAIAVRGTTDHADGHVTVQRNDIGSFSVGIDVANFSVARIEENNLASCATPLVNSGGVGTLIANRNRFGLGALSGAARLVAGVATVLTDEVFPAVAADVTYHIKLSRQYPAGALGNLAIGKVRRGVSFTVNSLTADGAVQQLDTSSFYWEIEH